MQIGQSEHIYTVSELNRTARETLEETFGEIWLRGEVSELTRAASGHLYFTLKDDDAEISAVRFRSRSALLSPMAVEQGMVVLALGRLTVYEPRGRYQFIASLLQPVGEGALQAAIERLKSKLQAEGLFDPAHKSPIPRFPLRIGLVTSPSGAALRDLRSVLERRWPVAQVFLFASSVQGEAAPSELVRAIEAAERYSQAEAPLDVLIVGRGGGSAEDLAAFSDERVVRAVHGCTIPTVSAVGHEIDFGLTDFAADLRAPTPSAAAELVVPDREEIIDATRARAVWLRQSFARRLEARAARLDGLLRGYVLRLPGRRIERAAQELDGQVDRLVRMVGDRFRDRTRRLQHVREVLRLSDPDRPLERGYSVTFLKGESEPIKDASRVPLNAWIETRLHAGRLLSRITETSKDANTKEVDAN